jgi:hypothetical protein
MILGILSGLLGFTMTITPIFILWNGAHAKGVEI